MDLFNSHPVVGRVQGFGVIFKRENGDYVVQANRDSLEDAFQVKNRIYRHEAHVVLRRPDGTLKEIK